MDNVLIEFRDNYNKQISTLFPRVYDVHFNSEHISAKVTRDNVLNFLLFLKHDFLHQLKLCLDIITYDNPGKIYRFSIVYSLVSIEYNSRYHVYTQTNPYLGLDSVVALFSSTNWSEREVWDIFGLMIWNHPDLRRILTDLGLIWILGLSTKERFSINRIFRSKV